MDDLKIHVFTVLLLLGIIYQGACQEIKVTGLQKNLFELLSSERHISNLSVRKNGLTFDVKNIKSNSSWNSTDYSIIIEIDSIRWEISDDSGDKFDFTYPNDFTLFYGRDKKELQENLIEKLKSESQFLKSSNCEEIKGNLNLNVLDQKFRFLKKQYFTNDHSEKIYSIKYPLESLVNLFMFPEDCYDSNEILLNAHLYGYRIEQSVIHPSDLANTLISENWNVWSHIEDNNLLLLLEHPFLGYHHMLYIEHNIEGGSLNGDLRTYIPSSNVGQLFKDFEWKDYRLKIKVE